MRSGQATRTSPPSIHERCLRNARRPAVSLSREVLLRIFDLGLRMALDDDTADDFLLSISAVCHEWRKRAIAAPHLWRFIVFLQSPNGVSSLERIANYLSRSGMVELDVVIHVVGTQSRPLAFFMQMVTPHLFRCQALSITLVNTSGASPVLPIDGYMPLLRDLSITLHDTQPARTSVALRLFGPQLQCTPVNVHIEASNECAVDISGLHVGRLRKISLLLPGLRREHLSHILSHSQNLRSLTLRDVDDADRTFTHSSSILAANLRSLALEDCALPLNVVRASHLHRLSLGLHGGLRDYSYLFPFMTPFAALQHLSIGIILDIPGIPALVAAFVRNNSTLRSLQLVAEPSATQILLLLASNPRTMPRNLNLIRLVRMTWVDDQAEHQGGPSELQDNMYDLAQVLLGLLAVRPALCLHWYQDTERAAQPPQILTLSRQMPGRLLFRDGFPDSDEE
ncbi:hypothetical protein DL93DRAFT_2171116 [Clavulina sp. PMI_390]|nr:hypothetical protein DL93DRAFT_2171116 [Clavulina sp. PMI_390]